MENASKALIMAGTLLIVMLVIGAGMFLFGKAGILNSSVREKMTDDQTKAFNQKFSRYEGSQKGSRVRELLSLVNKSNEENDEQLQVEVIDKRSRENKSLITKHEDNKTGKNFYYPKATLIYSEDYEVEINYEAGVVNEITIYQKP